MNKKHQTNPYTAFVAFLILTIFLSACQGKAQVPADKVTVQLSWFHSVEYAGFYAAIENGFYADENLDVTLITGGPEVNPLKEVSEGKAQFGISTGDSLITAKENSENYLAVATIFRQNPLVLMSLSNGPIIKPGNLAGKNIGVIAPDLSTVWDVQLLALLQKVGVEKDSVVFTPISDYHGANELTSGNMDAISGMFTTNEPVQANMDGVDLNLIYYKDYGVNVYSNIIFTSEDYANNNNDLVGRMVRATMKGYQFAIENPQRVAEMSLKFDPTLNVELQTKTMQAQIPLIDTGNDPIGTMDADIWESTQQILLDFNLISAPIDLNTVYTNKFVNP